MTKLADTIDPLPVTFYLLRSNSATPISVKVKDIARRNHFEHSWIEIFSLLVKHTMLVTQFLIEIKMNVINNSKKTWGNT